MIQIRNLYLKYIREYYALYDINLNVDAGETVILTGEENSGKTSLLRILAKLEKMSKGEVYIKDISLKKLNLNSDISMAYLPEKPVFLKNKTVYENLKYALSVRKMQPKEQEELINETFIDYNIEKFKDVKVEELTLLESYFIALVRMNLRKLDIVLIDNIFDSLNDDECNFLIEFINKTIVEKGVTTIIATTKNEIAEKFNGRIVKMENGSIQD